MEYNRTVFADRTNQLQSVLRIHSNQSHSKPINSRIQSAQFRQPELACATFLTGNQVRESKTPLNRGLRLGMMMIDERAKSVSTKSYLSKPINGPLRPPQQQYLTVPAILAANKEQRVLKPMQFPIHGKENQFNIQNKRPIFNRTSVFKSTNQLASIPKSCESKKYTLGNALGKGSYASVRLGFDQQGKSYAIKIYEKVSLQGEKLTNLLSEINTLSHLNHPQIVRFYDVYHTDTQIHLVLEYCGNQSLYQLLKQHKRIPQELAVNIFIQLMRILVYMHEQNVCHRDLKLENILIEGTQIKLIDFGFSTFNTPTLGCFCGTPSYMSPEIINKIRYDGKPSDIWSAGVLFAILLQGHFPFKAASEKELFRKIRYGQYTIDVNDTRLLNLIASMFVLDPQRRVTASQVNKQQNNLYQVLSQFDVQQC